MRQVVQLFINGQEVEFSTPPDILYTYKQTDLTNPTAVKNSFSKSITIDGTKGNNDLFGHIWNVERTQSDISFNASKKAPFELYINGTIYESGYVRLYDAKVTNKGITYDITLYGGIGDFFYNLTYGADGEERTLASLHFMTGDTSVAADNEFDFDVTKETIKEAWIDYGPDTTGNTKWKYINFAPSYNGIPDNDFDADKVLMNFVDSPVPSAVKNPDDEDYYYATTDGWSLGEMGDDLTEWEMRDIRSYLQRPVIRTKEIINACCNPENNGGYTVELDPDFFNSNNPYWEDSWMTLPMVSDLEYGDTEEVYSSASLICGDSIGQLPEQYATFAFESGTFSQDIMGKLSVTGKILAKIYVPQGWSDLYTSYAKLSNNGSNIKTGLFGALRCQLVAYNGDNVVGVSNTLRLTSRIYVDKTGSYIVWDDKARTTRGMYRLVGGDTNYSSVYGNFKLQNGGTYYWKPESGSENLTFNIASINTNITSLKMRFLWEASDDALKDYPYGALYKSTLHYGTGSDSNFGMVSTSACSMSVTDKNFSAVVGSAAKTGTHITKQLLLGNTDSPADYLISYCKIYGLYFIKDLSSNKVQILTRNNFYNNPNYIDLSELIDRNKEMKINPLSFTSKWYDYKLDMDDTQLAKKYENAYNAKYGMQAVNTGYDFDNNRNDMLESIVFKGAVEGLEKSKYFLTCAQDNYYKPYMFVNEFTYKLWRQDKEMEVKLNEMISPRSNSLYAINEELKYYDVFPKLQFHDKSNKGTDGSNVLVFFNGYKSMVEGRSRQLYYYLTDDIAYMQILNEGSCWLYTNSEFDKDGNRIAYRLTKFPVFERYKTQNNSGFIQKSMDFGSPRELYIPTYTHLEDATVYDYFWKNYISDLFSINSRVLDCYVKLGGKPNPEWLRNFYWFDNCIWRLNEINDWNVGGEDTVHMQFIKVQNTNNYTSVQPNRGNYIVLTLSKYLIDASGETITGTITAPSGLSWHVEYPSALTVSPITGTGNGTITIVVPRNAGTTRKSFNIGVVATGTQSRCTLEQKYDGEGAFTIEPRDLIVPASGGTYMLNVVWDNKDGHALASTYAKDSTSSLAYTADTQSYALTNQIQLTVSAYSGNTIITNYARFNVSGDSSLNFTLGICQLPEEMEFADSGETRTIQFNYMHSITITDRPFWLIPTTFNTSTSSLTLTAQNNLGDERGGNVTVACETNSETFLAKQPKGEASGVFKPDILLYDASGGTLTLEIGLENAWQIVGKPSWITVSSSAGTGTTTINVTAAENTSVLERIGSLAIYYPTNSTTYAVICQQTAGSGGVINPNYLNYPISGGTENITVNISGEWTIVGKPSWITTSVTGGTGETSGITVTAIENYGQDRTGSIVVWDASQNITYVVVINQDGPLSEPYLSVSPATQNVPSSGGTYSVNVNYANRGSDTITVSVGSDTAVTYNPTAVTWDSGNNYTLQVTIAPYNGQSSITHTITYSGVSNQISIEQYFIQSAGAYGNLDVNEINFSSDSGSATNRITTNVSWTAVTDSNWLSVNPSSGVSGSTTFTVSATTNNSFESRTGHIYFKDITTNEILATLTVNQRGLETTLLVSPTTLYFPVSGGTATFTINSNTSWTITEI